MGGCVFMMTLEHRRERAVSAGDITRFFFVHRPEGDPRLSPMRIETAQTRGLKHRAYAYYWVWRSTAAAHSSRAGLTQPLSLETLAARLALV